MVFQKHYKATERGHASRHTKGKRNSEWNIFPIWHGKVALIFTKNKKITKNKGKWDQRSIQMQRDTQNKQNARKINKNMVRWRGNVDTDDKSPNTNMCV